MRAVKLLTFVLALLALSAQLVRHVYVRWVEQSESVLHRYEVPVRSEIRDATSLQDLERRYAQEVKKARAEAARKPPQKPEEPCSDTGYTSPEPEDSADRSSEVLALRSAIGDWENKANEIREVRFFWLCGLAALLLAAVCQWRRWEWPALALVVLGFCEMVWWSSPSFSGGAQHEFTRLLDNKILFTVLSLLALVVLWGIGYLRPAAERRGEAGQV